jgi:hypothetical protein
MCPSIRSSRLSRVNAVGTDLEYAHDVVAPDRDGGFTVRDRDGPKRAASRFASSPT